MARNKRLRSMSRSREVLRTFCLERREDESGVSGTGVVALGVVLPSGKAVIEWTAKHTSVAFYDSIDALDKIHSHGGRTVIRFLDGESENFLRSCKALTANFQKRVRHSKKA